MAYNDFIKFATNHRNLLETAIKKYPTALKPSDLVEFDQVILETKKELRSRGLLENWKPLASFKSPEDFLYILENELILEAISDKIKNDRKINPATRSQINAIVNLRAWFEGLPKDVQNTVNLFTSNLSPNKNEFEPELNDIEEVINSMYGEGEKGGVFSKAAKNIGGWLTRGMSKLTGAGEVKDIIFEEAFSNANILENIMFEELFEQKIPEDLITEQLSNTLISSAPAILTAIRAALRPAGTGGTSTLLPASAIRSISGQFNISPDDVANATHSIGANVPKSMGTEAGMNAWRAVTGTTGTAAATGTQAAGATGTAAATGTQAAGAKGLGGAAATAGKLAVLKTGLMVGGGFLAAAAVYGGWTARDTRKRIESLLMIARSLTKLGFAPPPGGGGGGLPPPPGGGGGGGGGATKTINVFAGKGGTGLQSTIAQQINNSITDLAKKTDAFKSSTKLLNALKKDLQTAGFNVLEEGATAKQPIEIPNTVAVLIEIERDNPGLFKILRTKLLNLFNANNISAINAPVLAGAGPKKAKKKEEMVKNAKSLLSGIDLNKDHTFSKPEWDLLNTVADDTEIGGTYREAPVGRKIVKDKARESDGSVKFDNTTENLDMKKLKDYGIVMESLRRKYSLGLITLKEYNFRKNKIDMMILKEHVKRQVRSSRK